MTNNEIIAEFLGVALVKFPVDFDKANASDIGAWAYGQEITWLDGEESFRIDKPLCSGTFIVVYDKIMDGAEIFVVENDTDDGVVWWEPDKDIALWHYRDGILAEIEKRFLLARFAETLADILEIPVDVEQSDGSLWLQMEYACAFIKATPAQLTEALVKMIKED